MGRLFHLVEFTFFLIVVITNLQAGGTSFNFGTHSASRHFPMYGDGQSLHEGDLILEGNGTFTIRDRTYTRDGNIIVRDNATLIIENAIVSVNDSIILAGNAKFYAHNANISRSGDPSLFVYIRFYNQSEGKLDQIRVGIEAWLSSGLGEELRFLGYTYSYIWVYDHSRVQISDSQFGSLSCYNSASVILPNNNVMTGGIYLVQESEASIVKSNLTVDWFTIADNSFANIKDSKIIGGGINTEGHSRLNVTNSSSNKVSIFDYSQVTIVDSDTQVGLGFGQNANVTITGLEPGYVERWNLHINQTVEGVYFNLTIFDSEIKAWSIYLVEPQNATLRVIRSTILDLATSFIIPSESSSVAHIIDSTILGRLYSAASSDVDIKSSKINILWGCDFSKIQIEDAEIERIEIWDSASMHILRCHGDYVSVAGQTVSRIADSSFRLIDCSGSATVYLTNVDVRYLQKSGNCVVYGERLPVQAFITPFIFFSFDYTLCFLAFLGYDYAVTAFYVNRNPWIRDVKEVKPWVSKALLWFNPMYFTWLFYHDREKWWKWATGISLISAILLGIPIGVLWYIGLELQIAFHGRQWMAWSDFWTGSILGFIPLIIFTIIVYRVYLNSIKKLTR